VEIRTVTFHLFPVNTFFQLVEYKFQHPGGWRRRHRSQGYWSGGVFVRIRKIVPARRLKRRMGRLPWREAACARISTTA
jgi:hypothetical protein